MDESDVPSLSDIAATAALLAPRILHTPALDCSICEISRCLAPRTGLNLKFELFQHAGSFKVRGILATLLGLPAEIRARGVTAVSSGNHAIATAWAARDLGIHAKIVMPGDANPYRVDKVRAYGAEVVIAPDVPQAFDEAARLEAAGRTFIHPFDGDGIVMGTATLGMEWLDDATDLDAVIVSVGGGALIAGMAAAIKQRRPACLVFGVEPEGADGMFRSLRAGAPQRLDAVTTIADSLGAPYVLPRNFELCRRYVDEIVRLPDSAMIEGMRLLLDGLKLMCEPAAGAALAALIGPLRDRLQGARVGVLLCGSNIDLVGFARLLKP